MNVTTLNLEAEKAKLALHAMKKTPRVETTSPLAASAAEAKKSQKSVAKQGVKKRSHAASHYTKKYLAEMAFYIHPKTGIVTYNDMCKQCQNDCKQSHKVEVISCRTFSSK